MVDVWHAHPSCSAVAFRLRCTLAAVRADEGVELNAATIAYDDGRVVIDDTGTGVTGSLIVCQACGRPVYTELRGDRLVAITRSVVRRRA